MIRRLDCILSGVIIFLLLFSAECRGQTLVLNDDFSGGLSANWITGTNTELNSAPAIDVINGRVTSERSYDYIETKNAFSGDKIIISADLERTLGSVQCLDFVIEFTEVSSLAGIVRLSYGSYAKNSINVGIAPTMTGNETNWDCILQGDYLDELDSKSSFKGTVSLIYENGFISFSFKNADNEEISTPKISSGIISDTKIRIWTSGRYRFIDHVKIYTEEASTTCNCPDSDGDGVPDAWDLCPGTPPGSYVNSDGCDIGSDNRTGLADIIHSLQVLTGVR